MMGVWGVGWCIYDGGFEWEVECEWEDVFVVFVVLFFFVYVVVWVEEYDEVGVFECGLYGFECVVVEVVFEVV